jgi:uncharacterized protein YhjY with autotransporter beta-barrel domain
MTASRLRISVAGAVVLPALWAGPVLAQTAPTSPPPPTVAGASPLQQTVFNAVFNMCTKDLDNVQLVGAPVNDLHDQCHAIAVSSLTNTGTQLSNALGALQQVSGNQISTQGSLATRVSAGQFGNITGRLNALRLGSGFSATHGITAFDGNPADGSAVSAAGGRGTFLGGSFGDWSQGPSSSGFTPVSLQSQGGLMTTGYSSDGAVRLAQAGSSSGGSSGFTSGATVPNPWGAFIDGSYNSGHHDQTSNEDPFDFHATSVTAGIDYNFVTAVLGVSIGHDNYDAGVRASGVTSSPGSARVQGTSGSIYGAWFGQNWLFNGIATYGKLKTDLSRSVQYTVTYNGVTDPDHQADINDNCPGGNCVVSVNRVLQGNPDGRTFAIGLTGGYQFTYASWNIVPSVTANYRRATFDAFTETDPADATDGLGLAFNDQTVESMRSIVGLEVSRPVSAAFGVVTPLVRVEWNHEFKTGVRSILAHYRFDPTAGGVCDSCFALPTDAPAGNYGVAGAGLSVTLPYRIQLYVYDEALFGFSDYHSNAVTLGIRGQF